MRKYNQRKFIYFHFVPKENFLRVIIIIRHFRNRWSISGYRLGDNFVELENHVNNA